MVLESYKMIGLRFEGKWFILLIQVLLAFEDRWYWIFIREPYNGRIMINICRLQQDSKHLCISMQFSDIFWYSGIGLFETRNNFYWNQRDRINGIYGTGLASASLQKAEVTQICWDGGDPDARN